MDGITLACIVSDLKKLIGARIEKIHQPLKEEIIISLRGAKLLISANASAARLQLTKTQKQNPTTPPMFCTLLRKYIMGGKIVEILQPGFDRIIHIKIEAQDELRDWHKYTLIVEIMGKHSNIVLVNDENVIIDAIKHITPSVSLYRNLMPNLAYIAPPKQDKLNPLELSIERINNVFGNENVPVNKTIINNLSGVSPFVAQELELRIEKDKGKTKGEVIFDFFQNIKNEKFEPVLIINDDKNPIMYCSFDPISFEEKYKQKYDSIFDVLDIYYELKDQSSLLKQYGSSLQKTLQTHIERTIKKIDLQRDILSDSDKIESYKLYGELLIANAHVQGKQSKIIVQNYYDENLNDVEILLDNKLTITQNAQKYYKKYSKAKAAFSMADEQIKKLELELSYLEGQLDNLTKCTTTQELDEIKTELISQRYIKSRNASKIKKLTSKPMHFLSGSNIDIYVGKNNVQNEYLTLRFASGEEYFLHTKNIPGSHVIVKSADPDDLTLNQAAKLAVWYSKAKGSQNVPVDYTKKKFIKKPPHTPPGFVIYSTNKTAYITTNAMEINDIKRID